MIKLEESYSFDDVLILPSYSDILPSQVSLKTQITKGISINLPFISAAMDSVTGHKMATEMALLGGLGVIHKSMSIDKQCEEVSCVKSHKFDTTTYSSAVYDKNNALRVAAAIGAGEDAVIRAQHLINASVDIIVIDTSHGHSENVLKTIKEIKKLKSIYIIAGNVATKDAALALIYAGADCIKVGVGGGSICTTRIVSGVGVPQLSAILKVAEVCKSRDSFMIADGGIKYSGDIAKAIAAGADCVMLGSMLAGCDESLGELVTVDGVEYKKYRGMGSEGAMKEGSADRYYQEKQTNFVPQGVEGYVKYKGKLEDVLFQLQGGLSSAMGYTGNDTIKKMKNNCQFVKITPSGNKEGHPHSLAKFDKARNYG